MKKKILAVVMVALMLVVAIGAFIYHENHKMVLLGEDPVAEEEILTEEILTEEILTEEILTETILYEEILTENTITWDNVPTQEWP